MCNVFSLRNKSYSFQCEYALILIRDKIHETFNHFYLRKKRYFLILKCKIDFQAMHPKKLTISLERESHNDIFIYFHYKCNLLHIRSLPKREEEKGLHKLREVPTHFCFHKCSKLQKLSPSLFSFNLISFSYII